MELLERVFGADGSSASFAQMSARAVLVFAACLVYLRLASRRFLGRYSAFDWVISIILGSVLSRAINGSAPLWPTLGASGVLLFLHGLVGALAVRSARLERLVHGKSRTVLEDGVLLDDELKRAHLTRDDVLEELRVQLNSELLTDARRGVLERNGRIGIVRK